MISIIKKSFDNHYSKFRKTNFYSILKRTKNIRRIRQFVGSTYGTWLLSRFRLHGDKIHLRLIKKLIRDNNVTSIVETGTFLGYTTELLANEFPHLQIYSSEINKSFYNKARKNLRKYKNVKIYNKTSPEFLQELVNNKVLGDRPFFYLDAHWLDEWPLEQELQIISYNLKSAVISIDDFKVEGNRGFVYDRYNGKECSLELVRPNLNKKKKYNLLFPNYKMNDLFKGKLFHPDLIGYVVILQNMQKEFENVKKEEFVKRYYLDKSGLLSAKNLN